TAVAILSRADAVRWSGGNGAGELAGWPAPAVQPTAKSIAAPAIASRRIVISISVRRPTSHLLLDSPCADWLPPASYRRQGRRADDPPGGRSREIRSPAALPPALGTTLGS